MLSKDNCHILKLKFQFKILVGDMLEFYFELHNNFIWI